MHTASRACRAFESFPLVFSCNLKILGQFARRLLASRQFEKSGHNVENETVPRTRVTLGLREREDAVGRPTRCGPQGILESIAAADRVAGYSSAASA